MDDKPILASDAEREGCAARLRRAAIEGRIDISELDQRLAAAYGARTRLDLAALTADLPRSPGTRASLRPVRAGRTLRLVAWSGAVVNASLLALWLGDAGPMRDVVVFGITGFDVPWPAFLLVAWGGAAAALTRRRRPDRMIGAPSPAP
jgi:hypothetical protein